MVSYLWLLVLCKVKKAAKLIEEISRDGRAKKYINKSLVVGIITDEMHPYSLFSSNEFGFGSGVGMHLVCYYPYY